VIYLAAPYTSPDMDTRNWRFQRIRQALFGLWDAGQPAVCPVVLGHEYERRQRSGPREMPHEFWMVMARAQLSSCTSLYLLTLQGWRESEGVRQEVLLASGMGRSIQGYAPIDDCEDVSGFEILAEFGVKIPQRHRLVLPRKEE
jgi:hypothetical protein